MKRLALLIVGWSVLASHAQQPPSKVNPLKLPRPGVVAPSGSANNAHPGARNADQPSDPNQRSVIESTPSNNSYHPAQATPPTRSREVGSRTGVVAPFLPPPEAGSRPPNGRASASPSPNNRRSAMPVPDDYSSGLVEPGELLILLELSEKAAALDEIRTAYPAASVVWISLDNFQLGLIRVSFVESDKARSAGVQLQQAHPEWTITPNVVYLPLEHPRLYANSIISNSAATIPASVRAVKIGLLDTAVGSHPALHKSQITRRSFVADDERVSAGHATAIAALISGEEKASGFSGLLSGVHFLSGEIVRRRGERISTNSELISRGLDWLIGEGVQVINISLGGGGDRILSRLFSSPLLRFTVVVAAAGNSGPQAPAVYPAAYPDVIAVTAVDASRRSYARANRGSYIAIAAPGVDVWVPTEGLNGAYVTGTSFAAAFVTGAAAYLKAKNKTLGGAETRSLLCERAQDLGAAGPDLIYGCGLLQLARRND